jgi:hypothetical protein
MRFLEVIYALRAICGAAPLRATGCCGLGSQGDWGYRRMEEAVLAA